MAAVSEPADPVTRLTVWPRAVASGPWVRAYRRRMESPRESPGPGRADPSCTLDAAGRLTRTQEFGRFFAAAVLSADRPDPATLILRLRPEQHAGQGAGGLAAAET